MRLERIAIQEYKQFSDRIVIEGLRPGLNVLSGGNEEGKSTIAHAIRTAFLERYKGTTLKEILPWTKPSAHPRIEVAFEHNGTSYELAKQFFKPRCELTAGGAAFKDDDAEEQLANLLGFSRPAKGGTRPEHAGVPGLLWVQQGSVQNVAESAGHAAPYLRSALTSLAGGELSNGEDGLMRSVERELGLLLTGRQRRPTGVLQDAMTRLTSLTAARAELHTQREQFEADTDALGAAQTEFSRAADKREWEAHERDAARLSEKVKAVAAMEQRLSQLRQLAASADAELTLLLEQESAASAMEAGIATKRSELEMLRRELGECEAQHANASELLREAETRLGAANETLSVAHAAVKAADLKAQADMFATEMERLGQAIATASDTEASLGTATSALNDAVVDEDALRSLRAASQALVPLYAKRDAVATKLSYDLAAAVTIDGEFIVGRGTLQLTSARKLDIPGFGEFLITPGATDSGELEEAIQLHEAARDAALVTLKASGLDEAESRYRTFGEISARVESLKQVFKAQAPHGLDKLKQEVAAAQSKREAVLERLAQCPDVSSAVDVATAQTNVATESAAVAAARKTVERLTNEKASKVATVDTLSRALREAEESVAHPDFTSRRRTRQSAIVEKRVTLTTLNAQVESVNADVVNARAVDLTDEIKRLETAATDARSQQQALEGRILTLRSRLETVGATGLGERIAKLDAEIEQAQRRADELRLRADALSLLADMLVEERDRAVEVLRAPLTRRLAHYTSYLFPASQVELTDDLSPVALNRHRRADAVTELSWGTQEQFGFFARLAYADLLAEAGRPTLLMLDDVAVHTDARRRSGLIAALKDASTRHQVLFFTCHPELWGDLSDEVISIESLKVAA